MAEHLRSFAPEIVLVALATVFAGVAYLQLGPQWLWRTNHCPASTVSCGGPALSILGFGLVAVGAVWLARLLIEESRPDDRAQAYADPLPIGILIALIIGLMVLSRVIGQL